MLYIIFLVSKSCQTLILGILRVVGVCDGMSDIVIILFRMFSFDYCSFSTGVGNGYNLRPN